MTNLAISSVCNQDCPYCFTQDHLTDAASSHFLSREAFRARLDYLDRSGVSQARLIGGEPTLHPQFCEIVEQARGRGKHVLVFSNGLIPERALDCLSSLSATECTVLVNVNEPSLNGDANHERRRATIRRLRERVLVGFNIYRADFQLDLLLPIVAESGCQPRIRVGIAQPCLSGANLYIRPHEYPFVGNKIARFGRAAERAGVTLELDCGFVRCMFSNQDLEMLEKSGADIGWRCSPILDVDVDGWVIHCYPMSRFMRLPLTPETTAAALRETFSTQVWPFRQSGIFKECSICSFKQIGECTGGCLSTTIRRFRPIPITRSQASEDASSVAVNDRSPN